MARPNYVSGIGHRGLDSDVHRAAVPAVAGLPAAHADNFGWVDNCNCAVRPNGVGLIQAAGEAPAPLQRPRNRPLSTHRQRLLFQSVQLFFVARKQRLRHGGVLGILLFSAEHDSFLGGVGLGGAAQLHAPLSGRALSRRFVGGRGLRRWLWGRGRLFGEVFVQVFTCMMRLLLFSGLLTGCLLLGFIHVKAQQQNRNWVFCDSVGLHFSNEAPPVVFQTLAANPFWGPKLRFQRSAEMSACISDTAGNLLYYFVSLDTFDTDLGSGFNLGRIYDAQNRVIENGDGLNVNSSYSNGGVFVPHPTLSNRHLLFTLSPTLPFDSLGIPMAIYYHVIEKNKGVSKVIEKNRLLYLNPLAERLAAIRHQNGRDWWIIAHELDTKRFIKFLLTDKGVEGPLYQTIGSFALNDGIGEFGVSLSGELIASTGYNGSSSGTDIFAFNRECGLLYHHRYIPVPDSIHRVSFGIYGLAFSPNDRFLYAGERYYLFQYDLSVPDNELSANGTVISSLPPIPQPQPPDVAYRQMEVGYDGYLYLAMMAFNNGFVKHEANTHLSVIHSPNEKGAACDFRPRSFYLGGPKNYWGLPNMPSYGLGGHTGGSCLPLVFRNLITRPTTAAKFNGEIHISAYGGQTPYEYSINNGVTWLPTRIFKNLAAMTYRVAVRDDSGAVVKTEVLIRQR